jgi:hypothetical protein
MVVVKKDLPFSSRSLSLPFISGGKSNRDKKLKTKKTSSPLQAAPSCRRRPYSSTSTTTKTIQTLPQRKSKQDQGTINNIHT